MTTIIVVAIVALVFFVTVCVVTFMVWKRETEIRTDSIKAIERTMSDMAAELADLNVDRTGYGGHDRPRYDAGKVDMYSWPDTRKNTGNESGNAFKKKKKDPFSWVRSNKNIEAAEDETVTVFRPMEGESRKLKWTEVTETVNANEKEPDSNELSEEQMPQETEEYIPEPEEVIPEEPKEPVSKSINLSFVDLEDLDNWEDIEFFKSLSGRQTDYNMGRSGRKYTAEELEELIKE